ncbi:MAG: MaoC family dehydratase [Myxococcota bacterium]
MAAEVGQWSATSGWRTLDQARIDAFAEVTEDHQFIHVDAEAAAQTPFGGTIAHGFLTLSMLSALAVEQMIVLEGMSMGINYGLEKVRFIQPVRSGKQIRGHFALTQFRERRPGEYLFTYEVTVEIEGEEKPALVAEWLALQMVPPQEEKNA